MVNRTFALLAFLGVLAAVAANATEQNAERTNREEPASNSPPSISAQDASAIVRQAYGGRVVSTTAATRNVGGKALRGFNVRVDVKGRVKTVFVDRRGRIWEQR